MNRGHVRAWSRQWVQNPGVTVALGALLMLSVLSLPADHARRYSTVGGWLRRSHVVSAAGRPALYALRRGGSLEIKNPDSDSWSEVAEAISTRPQDVYLISFVLAATFEDGFYAVTRRTTTWSVSYNSLRSDRAVGEAETAELHAAFLDWLRSADQGRLALDAARLSSGPHAESRAVPFGYIHNTAALLALLLFLYSLAWIPRAPAWLAKTRAQRRLARGRCPHCNYSIAGLLEHFCPECGKGWNISAEDDLPPGPEPCGPGDSR